jgi:hypothetical protein
MSRAIKILVLIWVSICFYGVKTEAQTTEFTYQGSIKDGAVPANANYDLEFKLFDALSGGAQQGSTNQRLNVAVVNGIFTVTLDFGAGTLPGADRFLNIAVRPAGVGTFTELGPRQKLNSAPYAVRSLNAATADSVAVAGVPSGSANYIQNTTTQQAASNFNISGNGIVGGQLGVGTTSPQEMLHVKSSGLTRLSVESTTFGRTETSYVTPAQTWITGTDQTNNFYVYDLTANRVRMAFTTFGTVGIGTTSPQESLHIKSSSLTRLSLESTPFGRAETSYVTPSRTWITGTDVTNNFYIYDLTANFVRMAINTDGNVGVGTTAPQRLLHVNGRARIGFIPPEASVAQVCFNAAGDLLQCGASSLKWKTDVRPFDLGLETVLHLRPISFTWKESGSKDFGLGAEDVAKSASELTFFNSKGEPEGVKYDHLNVVFINAFKEQQKQIETQKAEIELLKATVCDLKPSAAICKK